MRFATYPTRKIIVLFSVSICFALCCSFQFARAHTNGDAIVDNFIATQEKKHKVEEYKEARKVVRGDLNGDGKEDILALYTLEGFGGTNLYLQYLAVFLDQGGSFRYVTHHVVGGKNRRILELQSVRGGVIRFA